MRLFHQATLAILIFGYITVKAKEGGTSEPPFTLHRGVRSELTVIPGTKTVRLTFTNLTKEPRFVSVAHDLTRYQIRLTTSSGQEVPMTPVGKLKLTRPSAGSVRGVELKTNVSESLEVDLGALFEFPANEAVWCELSHSVYFSHIDAKPRDIEKVAFPKVRIETLNTDSQGQQKALQTDFANVKKKEVRRDLGTTASDHITPEPNMPRVKMPPTSEGTEERDSQPLVAPDNAQRKTSLLVVSTLLILVGVFTYLRKKGSAQ